MNKSASEILRSLERRVSRLEKRAKRSTVEGLKKGFSEAKVKVWKYGGPIP